MVVGTLRIVLQIPGARSLKTKRQVVRRIVDKVRARFNVSIAEVGDNDLWQRATVGVAAVGNSRAFVNEVLDKVLRQVEEGSFDAFLLDHRLELHSESGDFGSQRERTLAEAEGLVEEGDPWGDGTWDDEDDTSDDDIPSQEELEAAARSGVPQGKKGR